MEKVLFLSILGGFLRLSDAQYNPDALDPVVGALLAECTFYGERTVDCSGRLRCHPSDVRDRMSVSELDQICPREPSEKSGTWDADQVIPASMLRNAGTGRVARCKFYANQGRGQFSCTGTVNADMWKGTYTGTMNTAFKLGLPRTSGSGGIDVGRRQYGSDDDYIGNPGRYTTAYPYGSGSDYDRRPTPYYGSDRYTPDRFGSDRDYYATTPRYGSRDPYDTGRYPAGGYGDRDTYNTYPSGSGDRFSTDRDRDRDTSSGTGGSGETVAEITMCTYKNDGTGLCRDCSERVNRQETAREIRTTRHYTCRGEETPTSWTENNGIVKAGMRPIRYSSDKRVVATCVFRPASNTYDCYPGASDGSCERDDGYGSSGFASRDVSRSLASCLAGEKWSGSYRGSIY